MEEYVIGADIGTSSTRVILFNKKGNPVSEGRSDYKILRPNPGWAEQDAGWWLNAFIEAIKQAIQNATVKPVQIKACGITHQRQSIVPLDSNLKPLRNAILWNDMRCGNQAEWANEKIGAYNIYKRTGFPPATWSIYKIKWIKENEPSVYEKVHRWSLAADYVNLFLAGEFAISESSAAMTGGLDISKKNTWADDILSVLEIDKNTLPERILSGGQIIGRVTKRASELTNLPEGIPVIATGGDQPCGVLGVGITKPGIAGINGGTSCTIEVYSDDLPIDPEMSYFIEISPAGGYAPESAIYSGGSALMIWYRDNFGLEEITEAKSKDKNVWEIIYNKAAEVPAGSTGLMMIPYFAGASGPYWDVRARGLITGFMESHTRFDLIRAIMEGQAYESKKIIESMEKGTNSRVNEVRMYGGSAVNKVWNQIFSDILGVTIKTTITAEATALGAAICAAYGSGIYGSIVESANEMVKPKDSFEPNPENLKIYLELYNEVYSKIYDSVKELMHKTSVITKFP